MDFEIKAWIDKIELIKLPRWEELPDIELYSEQVINYVNQHLDYIFIDHEDIKDSFVTASMINNYVKHKIMTPPIKKKYKRSHIAFIITITILKQVGSLNDVHKGIAHLTSVYGKVDAYNFFIDFLEQSLQSAVSELKGKPNITYYSKPVSIDLLPLKTATIAFSSIMLSSYLFSKLDIKNS